MLLYIVRHGETDWNKAGKVQGRTDIPLNERGRYLAEATAEGMKDVRIDFLLYKPFDPGERDGADHTWGKRNSSG
jgi:Fructose-2,6-bisphosphatase